MIKHLIRILNRILYSRCCATYRRNTWHASPGKFWFKMLRNALLRPCFFKWKDDICERPELKCTNSIWRHHFNVVETLRSITSVVRWQGCSFWRLKPKKGTLQKQLTVNTKKNPFFYLHLILTYWSTRFDSRNTYHVTGVRGYGFN